jgi:hypothetical protein
LFKYRDFESNEANSSKLNGTGGVAGASALNGAGITNGSSSANGTGSSSNDLDDLDDIPTSAALLSRKEIEAEAKEVIFQPEDSLSLSFFFSCSLSFSVISYSFQNSLYGRLFHFYFITCMIVQKSQLTS